MSRFEEPDEAIVKMLRSADSFSSVSALSRNNGHGLDHDTKNFKQEYFQVCSRVSKKWPVVLFR